jgi:hypothetical protein
VRRQFGFDDARTFQSKVTPVFNFGAGLRFYFSKLIALRLELRDYFYPEHGEAEASALKGSDQVECMEKANEAGFCKIGGLTFNLHFQGGLQLSFGGDE